MSCGVRRGRWCLTSKQVENIFEPVVKEVIALVTSQIKATQTSVKAVLMVGGFGQSAYLRDRLRAVLDGVEIMQSPNGYVKLCM